MDSQLSCSSPTCGFAAALVEQDFTSSPPRSRKRKAPTRGAFHFLAGGEGFEPPLAESESAVLPLDDPPVVIQILQRLADSRRGMDSGLRPSPSGQNSFAILSVGTLRLPRCEPPLAESESAVLPLDDPPIIGVAVLV